MPHGRLMPPSFWGFLGMALPGYKQRLTATQLDMDCCGKLKLTYDSSWLPGGRLVGPNQDPSANLKVQQCLGMLGGGTTRFQAEL